jgi:hypothetical protein
MKDFNMNTDKRQKLYDKHKELTNKAFEILKKKNHDYASGDDPYSNFRKGEIFNLCSTEAGILLRVTDKISRLATFANKGKLEVSNESYEDAVVDIINYMVLFSAYIADKDSQTTEEKNKQPKIHNEPRLLVEHEYRGCCKNGK